MMHSNLVVKVVDMAAVLRLALLLASGWHIVLSLSSPGRKTGGVGLKATTTKVPIESGVSPLGEAASLSSEDPEVHQILCDEYDRQRCGIELIASENFASTNVMGALGSCMTNKYSEGQPGARYYGGNKHIDRMEVLCQKRALNVFGLDDGSKGDWGVNVQPYSGSPANFAVFTALLQPHDRIMGLDLPSGGHLTHGYQTAKRRVSATSVYFESMPYRISPKTGLIDYEEMEERVSLFKPKMLIAGASAYTRDWDYARMRKIADSVGAYLLADMAHISGLIATGQAQSPFEHCDVVTSTTHKSLRGPRSGMIFYRKELEEKVNNAVFPMLQGGPHNHQIAALAVALNEAKSPAFKGYIQSVIGNARSLAELLISRGYEVVTGGTDNHMVLWDARPLGISGSQLEKVLDLAEISTNKNTLYGDTSALNPGGVRIGTCAVTTRGMGHADMEVVAGLLDRSAQIAVALNKELLEKKEGLTKSGKVGMAAFTKALDGHTDVDTLRRDVEAFASSFPLPGINPSNL